MESFQSSCWSHHRLPETGRSHGGHPRGGNEAATRQQVTGRARMGLLLPGPRRLRTHLPLPQKLTLCVAALQAGDVKDKQMATSTDVLSSPFPPQRI